MLIAYKVGSTHPPPSCLLFCVYWCFKPVEGCTCMVFVFWVYIFIISIIRSSFSIDLLYIFYEIIENCTNFILDGKFLMWIIGISSMEMVVYACFWYFKYILFAFLIEIIMTYIIWKNNWKPSFHCRRLMYHPQNICVKLRSPSPPYNKISTVKPCIDVRQNSFIYLSLKQTTYIEKKH